MSWVHILSVYLAICISSLVKALGTKRLATEELVQGWDSKRLNAGSVRDLFLIHERLISA